MASNSSSDLNPVVSQQQQSSESGEQHLSNSNSNGSTVVELIDIEESLRTQNIIKSAVKILKDYCRSRNTSLSSLERKPAVELCSFLRKFYTEVRQVSGKLYARKSMITLRYGLQRHFKRMSRLDIITDEQFKEANEVFSIILVKLRAMGKDAIKRKNPITEEDMHKIMTSTAVDQSTPRGLQNKVFIDLMLHLCNRGRDNLREITKMDFRVEVSTQGLEYVTLRTQDVTDAAGDAASVDTTRMYEIPGSMWCPLSSFKKYVKLLNPICDAFWQRPKQSVGRDEIIWYDNMPVGKNTLGTRMREISREAGCSQTYTNHCLRTTSVSTLRIYNNTELQKQSRHRIVFNINKWYDYKKKKNLQAGPSNQGYTGKPETSRRKKIATATVSSETVLIPDDSPPQPTAPKLQKKQIDDRRFDERRFEEQQRFQERRFENRRFDERRQQMAAAVQSAQVAAPSLQIPPQMQVKQHLQVAPPPPPPLQAPRQVQVLAPPPVQVPVPKPKPVEKPRPREKRIFVVADHQRCVMSNLASLWKSGKLCDAGIGNGSSTVMVHKVVLSAVCPKLLSVFSTDILSHKFLQVNFPEEVSTEALNAFAEYMYNGILDLDPDILQQLKIIAKRLDMKEFEQLCDSHLPNQHHQPVAAAATSSISFNNLPLIQTSVPIIPSIPTSHQTSLSSLNISTLPSVPSITTQVIDVKQEISEAELDQVKKDTAAVFGEESQVVSLAPNQSGNAGFVISPSIKTEPIGPEDDKYGRLGVVGKTNSSNNQVYTSSSSSISAVPSSSISSLSTAAFVAPSSSSSLTSSSILSSIPTSSTEYAIPFTDTIDIKTTELKLTPTTASTTYVTPSLMPDLSSVTSIVEAVCSQPSAMNEEDSTKPLTQQQPSLSAMSSSSSALEGPSLSSSGHDNIYPVGLFTAEGDNLPLLTTQTVGIKTIDLYKTDLT